MKTKENQLNITESEFKKLPPFKKKVIKALLTGERPDVLALRIAKENDSNLLIAQAYVKTILSQFKKYTVIKMKSDVLVQTPLYKLIAQALQNGEPPGNLVMRLSNEMDIPRECIEEYVSKVKASLET